jgi:hypothetical protein
MVQESQVKKERKYKEKEVKHRIYRILQLVKELFSFLICCPFPVVCPLKRLLPDKSSINIMERRSDEEEKILYYGEFIQISNP